jgi:uncharacterized protein YneF (UPF0154 family)
MKTGQRMIRLIVVITLAGIFLGTGIVSATEQKAIKKYPIPEHGTLELNVPTSWKGEVHKPQANMPPTIIFNPAKGNDFQVIITVLWSKTGEQDVNSRDKVRTLMQKDGQKLLPNAVETEILLQEIQRVDHTGYYFSVTDKAPNPGEYRYMTHGAIGVGNLLLSTTILHHVKESGSVKDALSALREAKQSG